MNRLFHRAAVAVLFLIAVHAQAQVPPDIEAGLQTIGHVIAPPPTYKLYTPLFDGKNLMATGVKVTRDVPYGADHSRNSTFSHRREAGTQWWCSPMAAIFSAATNWCRIRRFSTMYQVSWPRTAWLA
jgi:hypothetical protein